eukprot:430392-Pleurochrysis_carterae.AAC.12
MAGVAAERRDSTQRARAATTSEAPLRPVQRRYPLTASACSHWRVEHRQRPLARPPARFALRRLRWARGRASSQPRAWSAYARTAAGRGATRPPLWRCNARSSGAARRRRRRARSARPRRRPSPRAKAAHARPRHDDARTPHAPHAES